MKVSGLHDRQADRGYPNWVRCRTSVERILYGELQSGARSHSCQKQIFKDILKALMKDFNFDLTLWEALAIIPPAWCGPVIKGAKTYEQQRLQAVKIKRAAQKALANCNPTPQATAAPWT
ncbi:hypothetical protein ElyMa_006832800 [Elysia marginata]|uniref:Uncharacterized protein n=1 Tax=Elysia marginata TaxID=1093978 RepID=A0AAV4J4U6_9GAST|nr:hypothetical protein ElyMa_006832800 [Elysia marginata]